MKTPLSSRPSSTWRSIRIVSLILLLVISVYALVLIVTNNLHSVVNGELYRSAQPTAEEIKSYQEKFGIKTIVNLRGQNEGTPWYDQEAAQAEKLGIHLVNFRMSARRELKQSLVLQLIDILRDAEKPVLVHCKSGADRTGLAAALYLAAIRKEPEETAKSQLSIFYGHFGVPIFPEYNMDRTFNSLEKLFVSKGS